MIVLLIIVGIGLFLAINSSSKDHYQEWREQQPPGVGTKSIQANLTLVKLLECWYWRSSFW